MKHKMTKMIPLADSQSKEEMLDKVENYGVV